MNLHKALDRYKSLFILSLPYFLDIGRGHTAHFRGPNLKILEAYITTIILCPVYMSETMDAPNLTSQQKARHSNSQRCCRYRLQKIRSKGAILILFWTAMSSIFFKTAMNFSSSQSFKSAITVFTVEGCSYLFFPIAGWIADTWFGRYRVILAGMYISIVN